MYEMTATDFPLWAEEGRIQRYRGYRSRLYGGKEPGMKAERILNEEKTEPKMPVRMRRQTKWEDLKRRHGIALLLVMGLGFYGMIVALITGVVVHNQTEKTVRAEVESEMRAGFQAYLDQQEEDRKAGQFLSGEASFEAAVDTLADTFDELIATYAQEYGLREDALYGLGWTFIARHVTGSPEFGVTPQEIIEKANAWEGKVVGHGVRNQDTEIARTISRDFLSGHYPDGWTQDMVFGSREAGGGWVARTEFRTGPSTLYWRYQG